MRLQNVFLHGVHGLVTARGTAGSPRFRMYFPTGISPTSPSHPTAIIRRRPRRTRGELRRSSILHPTAAIASPPRLMMKRKPDVSPSAPLKRFRGDESAALFIREPYEAAIDRERAASVAAALEHAFWVPNMANGEGFELKIEDFLVAMTGAKFILSCCYPTHKRPTYCFST